MWAMSPAALVLMGIAVLPVCTGAISTCSNASGLEARIAGAFTKDGRSTHLGFGLSGVVDNVLSPEASAEAVDVLGSKFTTGGYGKLQAPVGFKALGVPDLANADISEEQYRMLIGLREMSRVAAEEALGMCPGTLGIAFTHFTQKTAGGEHRPHADNCFALPGDSWKPTARPVAACTDEEGRHHPYPERIAASILFLNDEFNDGEFFLADQRTGEPQTLVRGRSGRMVVFTSGPESLHGALAVSGASARIALALWYVIAANTDKVEPVPAFAGPKGSEEQRGQGQESSEL